MRTGIPEKRLCGSCNGSGAETFEVDGGYTVLGGGPCPDCQGTGEARTEKESRVAVTVAEEDKILDEVTKISVRVDRNGVAKSGTRAIPAVESLHPSVVALEFETLSRDVAKAAGLPVPDRKPKGLEDFNKDLVTVMEGLAGFLSRGYETYMSKGPQVRTAYRHVLASLRDLAQSTRAMTESVQALETAMTLNEFLGEDDK